MPVRICLGALQELKPCICSLYLIFLACLAFQYILFSAIPSTAAEAWRPDHHLGALKLHSLACQHLQGLSKG